MTEKRANPSSSPRRRRRTPESARREILDAAGRLLRTEGPDGLRLQSIAADLGISHSSILHHFGSRDGLLDALSIDAMHVLELDLKRSLEGPSDGDPATDLFEKIAQVLGERGYARLLAWQLMSGRRATRPPDTGPDATDSNQLLDRLAQIVHSMRSETARTNGHSEPELDETRELLALTACVVFGEALAGERMLESAGLKTTLAARKRFRQRIAKTVENLVFPVELTEPTEPTEQS